MRRACWACGNLKRDAHDSVMIALTARRALAALVSVLGWSGSMFAVGVDILHSPFKNKFAETANWKQATTEYKQQLWRGASHMSDQRRGLGDGCVLAVPAEYASASSGSDDHPQQYYLHRPKLTTLQEKDFFPICNCRGEHNHGPRQKIVFITKERTNERKKACIAARKNFERAGD